MICGARDTRKVWLVNSDSFVDEYLITVHTKVTPMIPIGPNSLPLGSRQRLATRGMYLLFRRSQIRYEHTSCIERSEVDGIPHW